MCSYVCMLVMCLCVGMFVFWWCVCMLVVSACGGVCVGVFARWCVCWWYVCVYFGDDNRFSSVIVSSVSETKCA